MRGLGFYIGSQAQVRLLHYYSGGEVRDTCKSRISAQMNPWGVVEDVFLIAQSSLGNAQHTQTAVINTAIKLMLENKVQLLDVSYFSTHISEVIVRNRSNY